jgi:thiopeptide-type bacteriocin biosynthesis protein
VEDQITTLELLASMLRREFASAPNLARSLGKKYRTLAKSVEALLDRSTEKGLLAGSLRHFRSRSQTIKPIGEALHHAAQGDLRRPLPEIAGSLLHMHVNRILRSHQRLHELVLYDMLLRQYRSRKALAEGARGE